MIVILAHQGGWDEVLFVIGPLLFIVFLLRLAKRRADRANNDRDGNDRDGNDRDGNDRDGNDRDGVKL